MADTVSPRDETDLGEATGTMAPPGNRHASTLPAQPATASHPSPIPALNGSRSPLEQTRSCAQASSRAPAVPNGTDQSAIIQAYEAWLRERRVRWATACMKLTSGGVISGWGYIATQRIEKGKEICRVPRAACFGSTASADIEPPALDSQQRIALLMYKELQLGSKSTWAPFLEILTGKPASPWCWPADAQRFLQGTELEHVLQEKLRRLEAERKSCGVQGMNAGEYRRLCALVASTTNPWFGGSIVPFNWTLNYARHPNVSFEAEGGYVVARATRAISAGTELTQEYAETTSELVYRYGFVPDAHVPFDEDVCSISLELIQEVRAADSDGRAPKRSRPSAARGRASASAASVANAAASSSRTSLVCASGALAPSPWDGLEGRLTVELRRDGRGTAQLVGVMLALGADDDAWIAVAKELESIGGDEDDAIAASLVGRLCGASADALERLHEVAALEGGEDGDPWPALLQSVMPCMAVSSAVTKAIQVVERRRSLLTGTPLPAQPPSSGMVTAALQMATALRDIESSILAAAERTLRAEKFA